MEKAIRVVSIERGRDPRHFALVAFGGAGGLHACALAEALSIPHVIVPALPGALSALGILASDVVKDYSRTVLWRVSGKVPTRAIESRIRRAGKIRHQRFSPGSNGREGRTTTAASTSATAARDTNSISRSQRISSRDFEQEHHRRYGYTHPNREVELVTLRLRAIVKSNQRRSHVGRRIMWGRAPSPVQAEQSSAAFLPQSPSYSMARNSKRRSTPATNFTPAKILRPRDHHRIQRHHSHPARAFQSTKLSTCRYSVINEPSP